ncbi:MAG: protein-L-isoaspartate O-methyltransferase, partial [Paracoccaceae bacterium]
MNDMSDARSRMVDAHVAARGISDARVIDAMRETPRELFVDPGFEEFAYEDAPLPIGEGQTISQPYIVAVMIEAAAIRPGDRALEVGAGSGYAAAVMGAIGDEVHAIERHPALARAPQERLAAAGRDNVTVHVGDGTLG